MKVLWNDVIPLVDRNIKQIESFVYAYIRKSYFRHLFHIALYDNVLLNVETHNRLSFQG